MGMNRRMNGRKLEKVELGGCEMGGMHATWSRFQDK